MPYDSPCLAAQERHPSFGDTLPGRLVSWIARRTPPACAGHAVGVPLSAHAMLQQILDRHPQARVVFTHLAAVESCLHIAGVGALNELATGTLERARTELLSISAASDVQPLLALLAGPSRPPPAQPQSPTPEARAATPITAPCIEHLEVHELDEQAYLAALLE